MPSLNNLYRDTAYAVPLRGTYQTVNLYIGKTNHGIAY